MDILPYETLEKPVYTKDEDYVGVVKDIENESRKIIISGRFDLRTYAVPASSIVSFDNGKLLLDMARDDFIKFEI
jgi:hypothetical protein